MSIFKKKEQEVTTMQGLYKKELAILSDTVKDVSKIAGVSTEDMVESILGIDAEDGQLIGLLVGRYCELLKTGSEMMAIFDRMEAKIDDLNEKLYENNCKLMDLEKKLKTKEK